MVTYFVVQAFVRGNGKTVVADQPRQVKSQDQAERLAQRLAEDAVGAVAFSRRGEPSTGEWEDAVLLARYGDVPDELLETAG